MKLRFDYAFPPFHAGLQQLAFPAYYLPNSEGRHSILRLPSHDSGYRFVNVEELPRQLSVALSRDGVFWAGNAGRQPPRHLVQPSALSPRYAEYPLLR